MRPIFLCGFMGCGKSTVGKILAKKMGCQCVDLDKYIEDTAGMSIPEIFDKYGEEHFRKLETEALAAFADIGGVVATGGGTILSEKSSELMRDHGLVVFLHRDVTQILDDLDMEIRPLLKESIEYIFRLYEERYPLYEKVSHVKVLNAGTVEDAVDQIAAALPPVFR